MPHIFEPLVSDLSKVPEPFHPFYQKGEDGAYAIPKEIFDHLDTSGLRSALDKERRAASTHEKTVKSFQSLGQTPEEIQATINAMKEEVAKKDGTAGAFEKFKAEAAANAERIKAEAEVRVSGMQKTLETHLITAEASRILAEEKGSTVLLLKEIHSAAKVVEENGKFVVRIVDAEGDPRYTASGNYMTLSDLIKELKVHPEFGKAFEPTGNSGSGTPPGGHHKPRNMGVTVDDMTATQKIAAGLRAQTR